MTPNTPEDSVTPDEKLERQLRTAFAGLRSADARQAPDAGAMLARARAAAAHSQLARTTEPATEPATDPAPTGAPPAVRRWRWALAAAPLAVAASVAALWLSPGRNADREFEQTVLEWSRVERGLAAPTDGLLAVPGSEYLQRLPALRARASISRRS